VSNSKELIGTTEYLTLYTGCRINRCRYNRVPLFLSPLLIQTDCLQFLQGINLHFTASATVNRDS